MKHTVIFSSGESRYSAAGCDYLLSRWTENGEEIEIYAERIVSSEDDALDELCLADERARCLYEDFVSEANALGYKADEFDWNQDGINL